MPITLELPTFRDHRGDLTVIEKCLPFEIKRVYYIYGVSDSSIVRGKHRHRSTSQALIAVSGSARITCGVSPGNVFHLNRPDLCLVLAPEDWHEMHDFSKDAVLLVLASEFFDSDDYIDDPEPHREMESRH